MSILPDSPCPPCHPLRRLLNQSLRHLLPSSCLLCGGGAGNSPLCPRCTDDLPPAPQPACPCCGQATTHGETCGACLVKPPHFDASLALFRYDFPVDRLIHSLKYGHQLALAHWLGQHLAVRVEQINADVVIPLPLHPQRLRERGFNQSGEIARTVARHLRLPLDVDRCRRTRATHAQADLPLKERAGNVRGAFEFQGACTGQHILLVDDVMTSGATLDECARLLKLHGAARVTALVCARAVRH